MHPVLFEAGPFTVYSYGFLIAVGSILGFTYMAIQAKRQFGMTFDQANTLFILLVVAGVVGGKLFLTFENPSFYFSHPGKLLSGNGFVFYGSLLLCIPTMIIFFRRYGFPVLGMLDIMAIVTCIVHSLGRVGCFLAGCCYGVPTSGPMGVVFSDPLCQAPLNASLHPTQLYEAGYIFIILLVLLFLRHRKQFDGQVFLLYLMAYAAGRAVIELFRGDIQRGYVIKDLISNSQFISLLVIITALYYYVKWRRKGKLSGITLK